MERRSAIRNLTLAVGGLIAMPSWAKGWTPEGIVDAPTSVQTTAAQELLAAITEAIIPETSTPGAKSLKVHLFVERMIKDCYGEEAQGIFKNGLTLTDTISQKLHQKNFVESNTAEQLAVLNAMKAAQDTTAKQFVGLVKNLTIRGYMNSEYVMVNLLNFNMAPGFYHGCVPLK
ncbi:gluconate 2-dehydrogenase subunit 3 family protein [Flectobacillus major]|jgi:hypothetical protein|uniref:gluconate 2-dehydrogenase subunit 3 family protein n=1 Tax=Flectobacillus major TaxID=103 RepID=UPI00047AA6C3|nr:gluconate 2-dehydrogenase subunit 3 family protein [Flectobacillus major]